MSIHGNQYILPLFNSEKSIPPVKENDELALAFFLLTKDLKPNEKVLSFAKLLWPFLCIQGVLSTHIILDGLQVFSKKDKLTNPPRQPQIGHILRNIENLSKIEQLNKIIEILTYKDREAEEIGEGEESEFQNLEIGGLVNPNFLKTITKLLSLIEYKPIAEYMPLETTFSTEKALDIAEKYRNMVNYMKGNAIRWDSIIDLIGKEVEKWLIDLNVQFKDISLRFSSQITKTSQTIDSNQIRDQLAVEKDKIDQWKVNEKKKIIENISVLFKTGERVLEDILKKNKMFVQADNLKGRVFEELTNSFENHFKYLIDEGNHFVNTITSLTEKYMEYKQRASQIEIDAENNLISTKKSLEMKLKDRDEHLSQFEREKQELISTIEEERKTIENLFLEIKNIIKTKNGNCIQESKELISWSLNDSQSDLFSRPIQWIYMPLYIMFAEEENSGEENMKIIFPGNISNNPNEIYSELSNDFVQLKNLVYSKIDEDIALRSNFEFSSENKNLLEDQNLNKKIQQGIAILRNVNIITSDIEQQIRNNLSLILNI
ncbi:MAG: hypothetical protein EAX89_08825 [Candidatus Lokiarchaeota archaeon]|nr:hypothetical protein [Candidatus Lokiarchaeota archaeon]